MSGGGAAAQGQVILVLLLTFPTKGRPLVRVQPLMCGFSFPLLSGLYHMRSFARGVTICVSTYRTQLNLRVGAACVRVLWVWWTTLY